MHTKRQKFFTAAFLLLSFVNSSIFLAAQEMYAGAASDDISGSASVFVFRTSSKTPHRFRANQTLKVRASKRKIEDRQRRIQKSEIVAATRQRPNPKPRPTPANGKPTRIEAELLEKEAGAEVMVKSAEAYLQQKDYKEAEKQLISARRLNPNSETAKFGLARVLAAKGDAAYDEKKYEAAIDYYEQSIALNAANPDALAALGESYDALDKRDKAISAYQSALQLDPKLTEIHAPLGTLYYETGNLAEAEKHLAKALTVDPNDAELLNTHGLVLFKQNRGAEAINAFKSAIRVNPNYAEAHYNLGDVYSLSKNEAAAMSEYREAIRLNPSYAEAYFDLGALLFNQGKYTEAAANYSEVVKLQGSNTEARLNLADAYRLADNCSQAINQYQIVAPKTQDPEVLGKFGFCLGRTRNWDRAIEVLNKAVLVEPSAYNYTNLAWAYNNKKQFPEAVAASQKAIQKDATFPGGYYNLGNAQAQARNFEAAVESFKKAVELKKDWAEAYNNLGFAYGGLNNLEQAAENHRKAVQLKPDFAAAHFNLGVVLAKRGKRKEAEKELEILKKMNAATMAQQLFLIIKSSPKK